MFVLKISIHAPRAGSDFAFSSGSMLPLIFQSTLPVRGATSEIKNGPAKKDISIHAPRAGSDKWERDVAAAQLISIHAPRAGSDLASLLPSKTTSCNFNPRSPCGERLTPLSFLLILYFLFQSTLPVRGATVYTLDDCSATKISIHAPRAGSDDASRRFAVYRGHISIHAPRAGSDSLSVVTSPRPKIFQSTLPVRGATTTLLFISAKSEISIHAPRAGSDT